MKKVVIVAAKRTAVGKFLGGLSKFSAAELGGFVIKSILDETKLSAELISEVILGQVLTAGVGQNPARQAAMFAGIPKQVPAVVINQVCGSGLKSVHLGVQSILNGDADIVIAGGQESMSLAPHLLTNSRNGYKMGDFKVVDSMVYDALTDYYNKYHMGITAENIAQKYDITRLQQDEFAVLSQNKAETAQKLGRFKEEIAPVITPVKNKDAIVFDTDEFIRHGTVLEGLSKLTPAFKKDGGTVTAGNSSGINDGAAAVLLMSLDKANELGLKPLAFIKGAASVGLDPEYMGLGPVYATQKLLEKINLDINKIDLIELNEAFAAQSLGVLKLLSLNKEIVNVNGGAIAIGHPVGASGCRILVTLIHEMIKRNSKTGLASLCIGGGMGISLAVERL